MVVIGSPYPEITQGYNGISNGALKFSSNGAYLTSPATSCFDEHFSIIVWVKLTNSNQNATIIDFMVSGSYLINNNIRFGFSDQNGAVCPYFQFFIGSNTPNYTFILQVNLIILYFFFINNNNNNLYLKIINFIFRQINQFLLINGLIMQLLLVI